MATTWCPTTPRRSGTAGWPYSYIGQNYDPRYVGAFPDLVKQIARRGRPGGVTVVRDGSLLVSDDGGNRIWKVSATAQR